MKKKELPKETNKTREEEKRSAPTVPESWFNLFVEEMEKEKGFYNKNNPFTKT